jgi:hypothetical protein
MLWGIYAPEHVGIFVWDSVASRLQIAKPDIVDAFEKGPHVLRAADLNRNLERYREFWRLAKHTSLKAFTEFLLSKTELRAVRFPFPQREVGGYTWGRLPIMETLQRLIDSGYYTHYTALRVHGLTEQVPKVLYITSEKSHLSASYSSHEVPFEQEAIDAAFQRPPRISKNECTAGGWRIVHLSSAHHGNVGVTEREVNLGDEGTLKVRVTGLERTLIDVTVRPFYAGGVFEVSKAFENAKGNDELSVNRMGALLHHLAFGYPYHQAIGFYLERAGYRGTLVDIFRRMPQERDFYLTHQMGETEYVKDWRLHIPKGF